MHPYLNTAVQAARRAGKVICRYYEQMDASKVSEKGLCDLVSIADKAAEKTIIETLLTTYPGHSILAEESGVHPGNDLTWIIDPLDGTMNFVHGFPQFAVSIALKHGNHIEHAVIYDPLSHDLYTASRGSGAQLNDRRIRVSKQANFRNALIGCEINCYRTKNENLQLLKVAETIFEQGGDTRKNGSAALNLAYVAAGRLDGFLEPTLQAWDIAAGILLVREAGGFVSDFEGGNDFLESGNTIAGTRKIHGELLGLWKGIAAGLATNAPQ